MLTSLRNPVVEEDLDNIVNHPLPWNLFRDKKVLITGANGFLPAYMVEAFLHLNKKCGLNINIIGLVRNKERAISRFAFYQNRNDLNFVTQDLCQPLEIKEHVDYIIHAASQASPKYYGKDPVGTLCSNVIGTYNLLNFARSDPIDGFLFFSSGEVYGQLDSSRILIKEDDYGYLDPTDVRSCYAESKRMGETMCVSWYRQYGVPVKIVRPFHTYGPGMRLDDGRVYADFVADILHNSDIVMKSDGSAIRAFCYLADAVNGFLTVLLKGQNGQAYNIGNDKEVISVLELAKTLVALFPERSLKITLEKGNFEAGYIKSKISRNCPDITKVRALGWEPGTSIEEGFKRTIRSFI